MDTDLLLTVLKTLLVQRRESGGSPLRLVLMSATVNAQLFSNYFDQAPVLNIPGRLYPVSKQYLDEIIPSLQSSQRRPLPFNEGGWVFQVSAQLSRGACGDGLRPHNPLGKAGHGLSRSRTGQLSSRQGIRGSPSCADGVGGRTCDVDDRGW